MSTVANTQRLDAYAEAFKALSRDDRRVLGQEAHESLKALAAESDKAAADGVDTQTGEVASDEVNRKPRMAGRASRKMDRQQVR